MLTRSNRLTSGELFARTVRKGRRAGTSTVVLHLAVPDSPVEAPQVGFVVGKSVGNAVVRNLVKRRLRHLARERLSLLPGRAVLVVRALPGSGTASYVMLASDVDNALDRLVGAGRAS